MTVHIAIEMIKSRQHFFMIKIFIFSFTIETKFWLLDCDWSVGLVIIENLGRLDGDRNLVDIFQCSILKIYL